MLLLGLVELTVPSMVSSGQMGLLIYSKVNGEPIMSCCLVATYLTDTICHGGWPLVGFPSVLAFNPNNHWLTI